MNNAGNCSFTLNWQGHMRPCVVLSTPSVSVFEEGFEFDATCATSTFVNCYYGNILITQENVATLLGASAANVIVANK